MDEWRFFEGKNFSFVPFLSFINPFAIRLLSVTNLFAVPSFIYPFSVFSSGRTGGREKVRYRGALHLTVDLLILRYASISSLSLDFIDYADEGCMYFSLPLSFFSLFFSLWLCLFSISYQLVIKTNEKMEISSCYIEKMRDRVEKE